MRAVTTSRRGFLTAIGSLAALPIVSRLPVPEEVVYLKPAPPIRPYTLTLLDASKIICRGTHREAVIDLLTRENALLKDLEWVEIEGKDYHYETY